MGKKKAHRYVHRGDNSSFASHHPSNLSAGSMFPSLSTQFDLQASVESIVAPLGNLKSALDALPKEYLEAKQAEGASSNLSRLCLTGLATHVARILPERTCQTIEQLPLFTQHIGRDVRILKGALLFMQACVQAEYDNASSVTKCLAYIMPSLNDPRNSKLFGQIECLLLDDDEPMSEPLQRQCVDEFATFIRQDDIKARLSAVSYIDYDAVNAKLEQIQEKAPIATMTP